MRLIVLLLLTLLLGQNAKAACTTPAGVAGQSQYISGEFKYCNNTTWVSMKYGGVSVASTLTDTGLTLNNVDSVAIVGSYGYVAASDVNAKLAIGVVDLTTPASSTLVNIVTNPSRSYASAITTDGTYLYMISYTDVVIYNLTVPTAPAYVGAVTIGNGNTLSNIAVSGSYIYVVSPYEDKLFIVDATVKATPALVGSYISAANIDGATDVFVLANYAYVANSVGNTLAIINVAVKSAPTFSGSVTAPVLAGAKGVVVLGSYAYVISNGPSGSGGAFAVIDVTSKTAPVYLGSSLATYGDGLEGPSDIGLNGNLVFVGQNAGRNTGTAYITAFDVSVPATPAIKNRFTVKYASGTGRGIKSMAISANRVFVSEINNGFLNVFDSTAVSQPDLPFVGAITDGASNNFSAISISGTKAIAVAYDGVAYCLDITSPTAITVLSKAVIGASAADVYFDGTYAYFASGNGSVVSIWNYTTPTSPVLVKRITSINNPNRLTKSGNYLYVTSAGGFGIIDVTTPASATVLSTLIGLGNGGFGIAVSGNYAYASYRSENRIAVINITTKTAPALITNFDDAVNLYSIQDIALSGNYIYAVPMNTSTYFTVVNITTPSAPTIAASITNANYGVSERIRVSGSYAYSMGFNSGLTITDISVPTSPVRVSSTTTGGNSFGYGLDVTGTTAIGVYQNSTAPTLTAWNASVPASVTVSGSYYWTGAYEGMSAVVTTGSYAYSVSSLDARFTVTNISTPSAPTMSATITDTTKLFSAYELSLSGSYAFVIGNGVAAVVNITTPTAPVISGHVVDNTNLISGRDIKAQGNNAFVAADARFTVVDHTTKTAPVVSASITNADFVNCKHLELSGTYAYMTCSQKLLVINIATPTAPSVVASLVLSGANGIGISGTKAYISNGQNIYVVDISTPASPVILSYVTSYSGAIEIAGNYLYAPTYNSLNTFGILPDGSLSPMGENIDYAGLTDVSISSSRIAAVSSSSDKFYTSPLTSLSIPPGPSKAIFTGSRTSSLTATVKNGNNLYLLGSGILSVVNVTDPFNPSITSTLVDPGLQSASAMVQSGNYLYVTSSNNSYNLYVYDVTIPTSPVFVTSIQNYPAFYQVTTLKVSGSYLYALSPAASSLAVVDITAPAAPVFKGSIGSLSNPSSFDVSGSYAYVCSSSSGSLYVISAATPTAPSIVGTLTNSVFSDCRGVAYSAPYVYALSENQNRLSISDVTIPTAPSLTGTYSSATNLAAPRGIYVVGNYAYIEANNNSVIIDVTTKTAPVYNDSISGVYLSYGVYNYALASNYVYVPSFASLIIVNATPIVTQGACTVAGELKYNTANNVMTYCNGSSYLPMGVSPGTGGTGCVTPTNAKGALQYRTSSSKMEYCDGTTWRPIN